MICKWPPSLARPNRWPFGISRRASGVCAKGCRVPLGGDRLSPWRDEGAAESLEQPGRLCGLSEMVRCRSRGFGVRDRADGCFNRRGAGSRSARGGVTLDYGIWWSEWLTEAPVGDLPRSRSIRHGSKQLRWLVIGRTLSFERVSWTLFRHLRAWAGRASGTRNLLGSMAFASFENHGSGANGIAVTESPWCTHTRAGLCTIGVSGHLHADGRACRWYGGPPACAWMAVRASPRVTCMQVDHGTAVTMVHVHASEPWCHCDHGLLAASKPPYRRNHGPRACE